MARNDNLAGFETENTGGLLSGLLAEEDDFDRRTLWRLGSWAAGSVGAIIIAMLANQSSTGVRREQTAAADLARQTQQIQSAAKDTQSEARRLASAVETLNSDRDRLYSRLAVLEQGLDSVTGTIARQSPPASAAQAASAPAPAASSASTAPATPVPPAVISATTAPAEPPMAPKPAAAPVVSSVATTAPSTAPSMPEKPQATASAAEPKTPPRTAEPSQGAPPSVATDPANAAPAVTPATPLMASKSMMGPPDPAADKSVEPNTPPKAVVAEPMPDIVASIPLAEEGESDDAAMAPKLPVQRTEFGVDVGGANSLNGLRALWRGLLKSKSNAAFKPLRPIIVLKENNNGLGMQLRLVAGPLHDAAEAAKICAVMAESDRSCATAVFEGQRLTVGPEEPPAPAAKPVMRRRNLPKRAAVRDEPPKPEPSTISMLFGRR
jgi:hypothetical protein